MELSRRHKNARAIYRYELRRHRLRTLQDFRLINSQPARWADLITAMLSDAFSRNVRQPVQWDHSRRRATAAFKGIPSSVSLEILHGALVLFSGFARIECAKVPPVTRPRVDLARIQPILSRFKLAYHVANLAD